MLNDPFAKQNLDPNREINTGEGEVPLANPLPNVSARTMASDIQSMGKSGSGVPEAYVPKPAPVSQNVIPPVFSQVEKPISAPAPANTPMPMDDIFGVPKAEENFAATNIVPPAEEQTKGSKKGLFIGLIALIAVIGIAALVYFVIYPSFITKEVVTSEEASATTTVPAVPTEENTPVVEPQVVVPVPEEITAAGTIPAETTSTAEIEPALVSHVSLFKQAGGVTDVNVGDLLAGGLTVEGLRRAFPFVPTTGTATREIVLKKEGGVPLSLGEIMAVLASNVFSAETVKDFNSDATMFVYTNATGNWLGVIAQLAPSVSANDVKVKIAAFEKNISDVKNFFLKDPGAIRGDWKNNKFGAITSRAMVFDIGGSFNYGWVGDKLIISTSYESFKEALNKL